VRICSIQCWCAHLFGIFRRKLVSGNRTIDFYQMQTLNSRFKGAAVGPLYEVIYANQMNYKNFTFRVLPEIIFASPVALYLPKNHFLEAEIERCIGLLHSAGLIDYWQNQYLDVSYKNYKQANSGPKILTFDHLSGIFFIWIGGCCVSLVCLCFEMFYKRILIVMRNLKKRDLWKVHAGNFHILMSELPTKKFILRKRAL
jgi:hypothetical protein